MLMEALLVTAALVIVESGFIVALYLRARRHRTQTPGAFRCRVRAPALHRRRRRSWRGRSCWATWAHDVLLVHDAQLAGPRVLRVRFPEGPVTSATPLDDVGGLGADPVVVRLRLDDGTVLELAAPGDARELVVGPFLAACITQDH